MYDQLEERLKSGMTNFPKHFLVFFHIPYPYLTNRRPTRDQHAKDVGVSPSFTIRLYVIYYIFSPVWNCFFPDEVGNRKKM